MRNCYPKLLLWTLVSGLLSLPGCSQESKTSTGPSASNSASAVDGSKYLLSSEPEDATDVIKAREESKDDEEIVITGRIGGEVNPWTDGRAAFLIVDTSLKSCTECGSDGCPTPWDYC